MDKENKTSCPAKNAAGECITPFEMTDGWYILSPEQWRAQIKAAQSHG